MGLDKLPEILTTQELAEFMKVSDQTVTRAIKAGTLKAFKVGKDWRIEKEAVLAWIKGKGER